MRKVILSITFLLLVSLILSGISCGEGGETELMELGGRELVKQQIEVNSTDVQGVKFVAPENGTYEVSIIDGAYCYLPEDDENWPLYGGYTNGVVLYINRPVEWGAEDEWGKHPADPDQILGPEERYASVEEAILAGQGSSVSFHLNKGDYFIAIVSDGTDYYFDNYGTVKIEIKF